MIKPLMIFSLIAVLAGCTGTPGAPGSNSSNRPPVIQELVRKANVNYGGSGNDTSRTIEGGQPTIFEVVAKDADPGDVVSARWSADGGDFPSPIGNTITWNAPRVAGTHTITVTVADASGAKVSESLKMTVTAPRF